MAIDHSLVVLSCYAVNDGQSKLTLNIQGLPSVGKTHYVFCECKFATVLSNVVLRTKCEMHEPSNHKAMV